MDMTKITISGPAIDALDQRKEIDNGPPEAQVTKEAAAYFKKYGPPTRSAKEPTMENERTRVSLIQEAIYAALGCTKIDYRSPVKMDEAAAQIALFVEDYLSRSEKAKAEAVTAIFSDWH